MLNHAMHMAAVTEVRHDTPGGASYLRKQAEREVAQRSARAPSSAASTTPCINASSLTLVARREVEHQPTTGMRLLRSTQQVSVHAPAPDRVGDAAREPQQHTVQIPRPSGPTSGTAMMSSITRATPSSAIHAKRSAAIGFCSSSDRYWRAVTGAGRGRRKVIGRHAMEFRRLNDTGTQHARTFDVKRRFEPRQIHSTTDGGVLVAAYTVTNGGAARPAPDAVATMKPDPHSTIPGQNASNPFTTPLEFHMNDEIPMGAGHTGR